MLEKIKIGTRGSKLALWQAEHIAAVLNRNGITTELVIIETKGDKILNQSLSAIGSKGLFTEELEEKLINGSIDIAVHSAKDMQSELNAGLEIIAFTEREKPNDVLVSFDKNFSLSRENCIVATSSTRRRAMLKRNYPHVTIVDVRGNLQTRFRKMEEGNFEAMLLAYAGVHRMGYDSHIVSTFPLTEFIPAVGQGSIAIETSSHLAIAKKELIRTCLNHSETETCLLAERSFLKKLQGGCSIPLFALAELKQGQLTIEGGLLSLDGQEYLFDTVTGNPNEATTIGAQLAHVLLNKGASDLLEKIKNQKSN